MERLQVKQWGNSKAIRLPKDMLAALGVELGDFLELQRMSENEFKLTAVPKKRARVSLQELLATTDENFEMDAEWDTMQPVGKEIL